MAGLGKRRRESAVSPGTADTLSERDPKRRMAVRTILLAPLLLRIQLLTRSPSVIRLMLSGVASLTFSRRHRRQRLP